MSEKTRSIVGMMCLQMAIAMLLPATINSAFIVVLIGVAYTFPHRWES